MADPIVGDLTAAAVRDATEQLRRELDETREELEGFRDANQHLRDRFLGIACAHWEETGGKGGRVQRILHDLLVLPYDTDPHTLLNQGRQT